MKSTQTEETLALKKSKEDNCNYFPCGCSREFISSVEDINLKCKKTFEMLQRTPLGVFQIEGQTSQKWIKKFQPDTFEELADFTSLARPGALDSGMMEEYIAVKSGRKEASFLHEDLRPILGKTHGALIYQEQIMEICWQIAGLTLSQADTIRKAVGKKNLTLMQKCKVIFIEGSRSKGYKEELGEEIWGWIIKFANYGFNKSHAVCYAMLGYKTAWAKTHYPIEFYAALLMKSSSGNKEQTDQILSIVNDAKVHGIIVKGPSLERANLDFEITGEKSITFGLGHIKGIGRASSDDVKMMAVDTYNQLLRVFITLRPKKTVVEGCLWSGALDYLFISDDLDRFKVAADYKFINSLTKNEKKIILYLWNTIGMSIMEAAEFLIAPNLKEVCSKASQGLKNPNKTRLKKIAILIKELKEEKNSYSYPLLLAKEKLLIGITLSGSEADLYDSKYSVDQCINFLDGKDLTNYKFLAIIERVRHHTDKKGGKMAFLAVSDSSYMIENCVIFASTYRNFGHLIEEGNAVMVSGKKSGNSFLINKVYGLN